MKCYVYEGALKCVAKSSIAFRGVGILSPTDCGAVVAEIV
jgi:hypothetical protein